MAEQFDTDAISSHAQATARCVTETEDALQRLISSGAQLVSVWTSRGGQAFQQQHADFTHAAQKMTETLQDMGQAVQAVAHQYDDNEARIQRAFPGSMRG